MGKAQGAADRIFGIVEHVSKINAVEMDADDTKKKLSLAETNGKIEFRDVWFRYPTRKDDFVLKGLNLVINPDERVALVGESGCGKSTFVNLLMRFYDIDSGTILLDDVDIREYKLHDLRHVISLVMQEPIIFNYSILENALYGKIDATNKEVLDACEIANAMEYIAEKTDQSVKDDSAEHLIKEMEANKATLADFIGG